MSLVYVSSFPEIGRNPASIVPPRPDSSSDRSGPRGMNAGRRYALLGGSLPEDLHPAGRSVRECPDPGGIIEQRMFASWNPLEEEVCFQFVAHSSV